MNMLSDKIYEDSLLIEGNNIPIRKYRTRKNSWLKPCFSKCFILQKLRNHIHFIYNTIQWRKYLIKLIYYISFYVIICILFIIYMYSLFYFTILADYPKLTGLHNQLKLNPGLSIIPNSNRLTSLIHFYTSNPVSYSSMIDEMTGFLSYYQYHIIGGMFESCEMNPKLLNMRRPCRFNLDSSGPCNLKNGYGYYEGKPCFIIKLNRIYGWLPIPLNNYTNILLKCEGLTKLDSDYLGKICYYDSDSLKQYHSLNNDIDWCYKNYGIYDSMFYPYLNQAGYQSPLVFVHFLNPKRHVIIWIKCYALAKNIHVNIHSNEGSIVFQILVD